MKRLVALIVTVALMCSLLAQSVTFAASQTESENLEDKIYKLWYDEPAEQTNSGFESQSLPLGNGYMGVNVFGGTETELISVTENSLVNPQGSGSSYGPDGDKRPSANMGGLNLLAKTYIDFGHTDVTEYTRDLVLNDAIAHTEYTYNGITYNREYFTSYPDKVMVLRLTASEDAAISFTLRPIVPFERDYLTTEGDGMGKTGLVVAENDTITLTGMMNYYQTNFEAQYKVIPSGDNATMTAANDENGDNGTITVSNADSVVILLAAGTNYHMTSEVFTAARTEKLDADEYPHEKVTGYINAAAAKSYETLKEEHLKDYQEYFDRVDLDLGGELSDSVTTDELLANYKTDSANNLYLEELIFQFGRYLLIASSREGCLPANLQGIWNFYESSPWSAGYWHNINLQMNYWPAFNTNLLEMFESYADFNGAFREAAEACADTYLTKIESTSMDEVGTGSNGWAVGTGVWPYSVSAPSHTGHDGPSNAAFTSTLFWEYYNFTMDKTILAEHTFPAIYGTANFLSKTLQEYENGEWLVANSASPEVQVNGSNYRTTGSAYDQQNVYQNYWEVLKAAEILGYTAEDYPLLENFENQIDHLEPVLVGYSGQVKEYREEDLYGSIGDELQHRHVSQLVGLYPGNVITSETDAWMDAAKVTLNNRGDGTTGWSIGHRLNLWARVKDGNRTYQLLQKLLKNKIMNNLWDTHPPFQIDGNFGATSGMAEMLIQSHEGYIALLPAIPESWSSGSYRGLTARGNFEVDASWDNGQATKFTVRSKGGENCSLRYYNIADATIVDSNGNAVTVTKTGKDIISFDTVAGGAYTITNIPSYTPTAAPSELTVTYLNNGENTVLNWSKNDDASNYNVYRAKNSAATYDLIASGVTDTTYTIDEAKHYSDQYTYCVTAVDSSGRESMRTTLTVSPTDAPDSAKGVFTDAATLQIIIEPVSAMDGYRIYKQEADGSLTLVKETPYSAAVVTNADPTAVYVVKSVQNSLTSDVCTVTVEDVSGTISNKLEMQTLLEKVDALDLTECDPVAVKALNEAKAAAVELFEQENPAQEDLDAATAELQWAFDGIYMVNAAKGKTITSTPPERGPAYPVTAINDGDRTTRFAAKDISAGPANMIIEIDLQAEYLVRDINVIDYVDSEDIRCEDTKISLYDGSEWIVVVDETDQPAGSPVDDLWKGCLTSYHFDKTTAHKVKLEFTNNDSGSMPTFYEIEIMGTYVGVKTHNAYKEINVLGFAGSDATGYVDYCNYSARNYQVAGDSASGVRSVQLRSGSSLAARNVSFGGSVPRSIVINMDLRKDSGYFGNSSTTAMKIYAFPYGTKITTVSGGAVTAFTLPNTETSATNASDYLIVDQKHDARWEREYGANDFVKYEYVLNGSDLERLKTGNWDVVITGGHGAAYVTGNGNLTMVLDSFYFNKEQLDAYNVQDALYNGSIRKGWPEQSNTGALGTNSYETDSNGNSIEESYVEFHDVDFGSESQNPLAAVLTYSSKDGLSDRGNLIIEVKDGDAWVEYGRVKVVSTGTVDQIYPTNHRVLLNQTLSGVHDVRVSADSNFFVKLFNVRFEKIDDLSNVYGDVAYEENEDGSCAVTLPVNMDYIKESAKALFGIYDEEGRLLTMKAPVDYAVNTSVAKATTSGENVARADSGWTNTTTVTFTSDELTAIGGIAGKTIKAFLWKDLETLVPLTPVSAINN